MDIIKINCNRCPTDTRATVDCVHETISSLSVAGSRRTATMTWFLAHVTKATVECMAGTSSARSSGEWWHRSVRVRAGLLLG